MKLKEMLIIDLFQGFVAWVVVACAERVNFRINDNHRGTCMKTLVDSGQCHGKIFCKYQFKSIHSLIYQILQKFISNLS